jgi:hypothetical protein
VGDTFRIRIESDLKRRLELLGGEMARVVTRAFRRAVDSTYTFAVRAIAEDLGVRRRAVERSLERKYATFRDLTAWVRVGGYQDARGRWTRGGRIPLIDFDARGPEPSRGRGQGVSYRLRGGRNRRRDAFIATMRSGHRGVYVRTRVLSDRNAAEQRQSPGAWGPNLPITELFGPSPSRVFQNKFVVAAVAHGEGVAVKELDRQYTLLLGGGRPSETAA